MGGPLTLLCDESDQFLLTGKDEFGVVLEGDLDDFVGKAEKDGVSSASPALYIHRGKGGSKGSAGLEVGAEVLQKRDFLLEECRERGGGVEVDGLLVVFCLPFYVPKRTTIRRTDDLRSVIEHHSNIPCRE